MTPDPRIARINSYISGTRPPVRPASRWQCVTETLVSMLLGIVFAMILTGAILPGFWR